MPLRLTIKICDGCGYGFTNSQQLIYHKIHECKSNKSKTKVCPNCNAIFTRTNNLNQHIKNSKNLSCTHCTKTFCNNEHLQRHLRSIIKEVDDKDDIPDLKQQIYPKTGYEEEDGYLDIIHAKQKQIKDEQKKKKHYTIINKQIDYDYTYNDLNLLLIDIYGNQKSIFKLNIGFGYILYDTKNDIYKYHYVSNNNMLFENAVPITSKKDLTNIMKHIISLDLPTNFYLKKPSSSWILAGITNVEILIIPIDKLIGHPPELPDYIKNSRAMHTLVRNHGNNYPYSDNKCFFFRCMALHQGESIYGLEKRTERLKKELESYIGYNLDEGIFLEHIPDCEIKFKVAINIYNLKENGDADILYLSRLDYRPLHLNLYENHFSFIKDFKIYSKRYQCSQCERLLTQSCHLTSHAKICCTDIKEVFIGGKYKTNDTLFERLEKIGINIPEEDR